jgi:hypothetical protein
MNKGERKFREKFEFLSLENYDFFGKTLTARVFYFWELINLFNCFPKLLLFLIFTLWLWHQMTYFILLQTSLPLKFMRSCSAPSPCEFNLLDYYLNNVYPHLENHREIRNAFRRTNIVNVSFVHCCWWQRAQSAYI